MTNSEHTPAAPATPAEVVEVHLADAPRWQTATVVALAGLALLSACGTSTNATDNNFHSRQEFVAAWHRAVNPGSVWDRISDSSIEGLTAQCGNTPELETDVAKLAYAMNLDKSQAPFIESGFTEIEYVDLMVRSIAPGVCRASN